MTAGDREYVARLGAVLRQRDVPALRAFLEEQAGRYGDAAQVEAIRRQSDAELELLLHRMILARPDLRELHADSQRWLSEHGVPGARPGGPQRRPTPPRRPPDGPGGLDGRRDGTAGHGGPGRTRGPRPPGGRPPRPGR